jgi:hypothetical protein
LICWGGNYLVLRSILRSTSTLGELRSSVLHTTSTRNRHVCLAWLDPPRFHLQSGVKILILYDVTVKSLQIQIRPRLAF